MMDPQQELFTKLLTDLRQAFGPDAVYDAELPKEGTEYPFVYIGETMLSDEYLKNAIFGTVSQTIHIWHDNPRKRGSVSAIAKTVKEVCRRVNRTENFGWMLTDISQQMLTDTTTAKPLIHSIIDVTYRFS